MNAARFAAILLVGAVACQQAETPQQASQRMSQEAAAARTAIAAVHARWSGYIAAGHPDSVAVLYTAGARGMGPDEPTAVGREAIRRSFGGMTALGSWTIRLTSDSIWANGPLVFETGTYRAGLKPGPGAPRGMDTVETGKYWLRWTKDGDQWLIADDMHVPDKSMMTTEQMAAFMRQQQQQHH